MKKWIPALILISSFGFAQAPVVKKKKTVVVDTTVYQQVAADDLIKDYSPNFLEGQEKWTGKAVEVTGKCYMTSDEDVTLIEVGDIKHRHMGLVCELPASAAKTVGALVKGQALTVKGIVQDVSRGCVIIKGNSIAIQ